MPDSERSTRETSEVGGWIVVCPSWGTQHVLAAVTAQGCIQEGIEDTIRLDYDSRIGEGGYGSVFKGVVLAGPCAGDEVAVKRLHPGAADEQSIRREFELVLANQGSDCVIRLRGLFVNPGPRWYFVYDYHFLGDWAVFAKRSKGLPEKPAMKILRDLFRALAHLADRGVVHRDVKAENVLVTSSGGGVLTDFGLATRMDDKEEMSRKMGWLGRTAPEVLLGLARDGQGDVYGAGVSLYYALTLQLPFTVTLGPHGRQTRNFEVQLLNCTEVRRTSRECQDLLQQLLRSNPECRPSAALALRHPAVALVTDGKVQAPLPTKKKQHSLPPAQRLRPRSTVSGRTSSAGPRMRPRWLQHQPEPEPPSASEDEEADENHQEEQDRQRIHVEMPHLLPPSMPSRACSIDAFKYRDDLDLAAEGDSSPSTFSGRSLPHPPTIDHHSSTSWAGSPKSGQAKLCRCSKGCGRRRLS